MNTRLIIIISFAALTLISITFGAINYANYLVKDNKSNTSKSGLPEKVNNTDNKFSYADVKSHDSKSSCWIIANNKVYDISRYVKANPLDTIDIIPFCGTDSTRSLETKNSVFEGLQTVNILNNYYIGDLN
jgi:cytochrome b involved in lipid metabolism